jgi:hypothetical protein
VMEDAFARGEEGVATAVRLATGDWIMRQAVDVIRAAISRAAGWFD